MTQVKLKKVRISFPDLYKAKSFLIAGKPTEPKYGATFLIEPGSDNFKAIQAAIKEAAKEKWKDKAGSIIEGIKDNPNKFCFRNGKTKPDWEGYQGMWFISAKNKNAPTVFDRDGKTPLPESSGKIYSGCYVSAIIEIFAYDTGGNGISAELNGVMYHSDGDNLGGGGRRAKADEFGDLSDGADAEDFASEGEDSFFDSAA